MSIKSDNTLIRMDDKGASPILCEFCFGTMNTLNNLLFDDTLENECGIQLINTLLMYARYFNIQMGEVVVITDTNKSYSTSLMHLTVKHENLLRKLCDVPIQSLYNIIGDRLKKSKGIRERNSIQKDGHENLFQ